MLITRRRSAVGRVEWNITGYDRSIRSTLSVTDVHLSTVLSSAGNDGRVRLWKATIGSVWRPAGSIGVEQSEDSPDADAVMDDNAVGE